MRISRLLPALFAASLALGAQWAQAQTSAPAAASSARSTAAAAGPEQAIREHLAALQPNLAIDSIDQSPLAGLYQVQLKGGRVLYASADGQFVMQGYLYQIKDGQPTNLTEKAENVAVAKQINGLDRSQLIVFPAQGETKAHITVFTDTTCPYCQKLHAEVSELNKRGIEVRYLAFPRQGMGSAGAKQLEAVWCAQDKPAALSQMFAGREIKAAASCKSPVAEQFAMGQNMGIQGTPAIVLADGQILPGYQPAEQLVQTALDGTH